MRHGETDWNVRRKLQGHTDVPLNDNGRKMAKEAAEKYKDVHFDVCYCSPLIRAKETAEIFLSGRDVPIITDDRLQEMSFGEFEGLAYSFEIPNCPINTPFLKPEDYTDPPGGAESFDELFEGVKAIAWEDILPPDAKFWVTKASSVKSALFSSSDIQSIVKKAIVDRLREKFGIDIHPEVNII